MVTHPMIFCAASITGVCPLASGSSTSWMRKIKENDPQHAATTGALRTEGEESGARAIPPVPLP